MLIEKTRTPKVKDPPTGEYFHGKPVCSDYEKGDTVRTIWISQEKGIKALYDVDNKRVISYLFAKDKWSKAEADTWTKKHDVCQVQRGEKKRKPRGDERPKGEYLREDGLTVDDLVDDGYAIDLPTEFTALFARVPQSGDGFHNVNVHLKSGDIIRGCQVYNGHHLRLPSGMQEVRPLDIEEIVPESVDLQERDFSFTSRELPRTIRPKLLPKGGTIGITAPSSQIIPSKVARGISWLKQWGYKVKLGTTVATVLDRDLTSASELTRAQDLMDLFEDKEVDAILTATGGYGAAKLLKHLDFDVFRRNPKPISGFSDTTALLNAITLETGLITFLGPTVEVRSDNEDTCVEYLKALLRVLSSPRDSYELVFPPELSLIRRVQTDSGTAPAAGTLLGGNLTLVSRLVGTSWQIPGSGTIVALEEIGEAAFMVDSLLQQLEDGGTIKEDTPLVFGDFTKIPTEHGSSRGPQDADASVYDLLRQRYANHKGPVLTGWPFSHGTWNMTLPLGARVRVDPLGGTIFVIEPVVE